MRRGKIAYVSFLLFAAIAGIASSQNTWSDPFPPSPVPFSLNSYDVIQAVEMIKRERFLIHWDYESAPVTIIVNEAYSVPVGRDPAAFEEHRSRYDIILNGQPLDWDHTYIEYGTEMVNLRLLYTYRNQQPIPSIPYRLDYSG